MIIPASEAAHSAVDLRVAASRSFDRIHKRYSAFIRAAAWRYRWCGADRDDLRQAGRLGLWRALSAFDAGRGAPFESYAHRAIRRAVRDEARRHLTYAKRVAD